QLWSWGLASLGVFALYLITHKRTRTAGWATALGIQVLWVTYAVVTRQWGFIASAVAYGTMYGKNLFAWRRESAEIIGGEP
ncbi:MAG TPA: hypothetical protein VIV12_06325, partial [Streptosporangiaceae bacterium]